jgi:7-cyano-7-deazaguanine reductase
MDFAPQDQSFAFDGPEKIDPSLLETFPYEYPYRQVELRIETNEFSAVCPFSGLPDYGILTLDYTPSDVCIELRALKYYLLTYRTVGIWYEHAVNRLLEDLVRCLKPHKMRVHLNYNVRGGLRSEAIATYDAERDEMPDASPDYTDARKNVSSE